MIAACAYVWSKIPDWIKWPLTVVLILMWAPLYLRDKAQDFIQAEVHAVVDPINNQKDLKISVIEKTADRVERKVEAIGFHLMGQDKFIKLTADGGDNK